MDIKITPQQFETIMAALDCAEGMYRDLAVKDLPSRIQTQFLAQAEDARDVYVHLEMTYR